MSMSPATLPPTVTVHSADRPPRDAAGRAALGGWRRCCAAAWDSAQRVGAIARWEVLSFALRPTAWLLLLTTSLVAGWSFAWLVTLLSLNTGVSLRPAEDPVFQFLGPNVFFVGACTLLVPLLTMNLIADERRRGTWETLLTAPVTARDIVLGKFFAGWCLLLGAVSPWLYFLVCLRCWNGGLGDGWAGLPWFQPGLDFDLGPVCGAALGVAVIGATWTAGALVCSGLCRTPLSAALLTFCAMLLVLLLSVLPRGLSVWGLPEEWVARAELLACWNQLGTCSQGLLEPRMLLGHLSVTVLLLTGAMRMLRDRIRWLTVLAGLLLVNAGAGWLLPAQIDLTRRGEFTLSPMTHAVLQQIAQPVEISVLSSQEPRTAADRAFAAANVLLEDLLQAYRAVRPELRIVQLDPDTDAHGRQLLQRYPDVTSPAVLITYGAGDAARHEVLRYRDLLELRDATDGQVTAIDFLGEQAVTAALQRLVQEQRQVVVYALCGHGELNLRDADPHSRRGLGVLSEQLARLDCELRPLDLRTEPRVPRDADVVLLAGPEVLIGSETVEKLQRYLTHGGRALCLLDYVCDVQTGAVAPTGLEPLLQRFGVLLGRDRVITRGYTGQLQVASPALPAAEDHPLTRRLAGTQLPLFECRSLGRLPELSTRAMVATPILVSQPFPQAWADGDPQAVTQLQPGGPHDIEGPVAMAVAVERQRGAQREPVLVVVGDAEFAANHGLSGAAGRTAFSFLLNAVHWLRGGPEGLADIPPRSRRHHELTGTAADHRRLVWGPSLLWCAAVVTAGATVWTYRQRG